MRVGILGGGFGIYGYLPAFERLNFEIHTLERYRESILNRSELEFFDGTIRYSKSEAILIENVDILVIARIPRMQVDFLVNNMDLLKEKYIFLEKPLSSTILQHQELINLLELKKINFSVAYIFAYTDWFQQITSAQQPRPDRCQIEWVVPKPLRGWKLHASEGGGLGDFYAIHFIVFFLKLDVSLTQISIETHADSLQIQFHDNFAREWVINVSFGSPAKFEVIECTENSKREICSIETPFGSRGHSGIIDSRVDYLTAYIVTQLNSYDRKRNLDLERKALAFRIALSQDLNRTNTSHHFLH